MAARPWPARQDRWTSAAAREAFAVHLVAVLNDTARSLDPRPLLRLSAPRCAQCRAIAQLVRGTAARGGRIEGGAWRVVDAIALETGSDARRQVNVAVDCGAQTLYASRGSAPVHFDAGRTVFTFDIGLRAGRWAVLSIRGAQG